MSASFITIPLWVISFILVVIALLTLLKRKEGSFKKAILEFAIAVLTAALGFYVNSAFDFIATNFPILSDKTDSENSTSDIMGESTPTEKTEHIHTDYVTKKENIIDATCIYTGNYESVVYCKCGEELHRENIIVEALGHNYTAIIIDPTCYDQGFTALTCSRCGDSYVDEYINSLGHDFMDGVCTRCRYTDPDYIKVYDSNEIMRILSESVVSSSGNYSNYLGTDSISVFAEEQYNCFSIRTAVSYNIWGHNVQNIVFNISNLNELNMLNFDIGGATGSSGSMKVEIFIDKTLDDIADYTYDIEASYIPTNASIKIKNATSLSIRVTNNSNTENSIVFFNFSGEY